MPNTFAAPIPLTLERSALLAQLCEGLDAAGFWWISGFAAANAQALQKAAQVTPLHDATAVEPAGLSALATAHAATIIYGTQTGNAKQIANLFFEQLQAAGIQARVLRSDAYPLKDLKSEKTLYVVISTQGDGDPPEDSRAFVEHLLGRRAPDLAHLHFAVLGLGDSSYPKFCSVAKALDLRFGELGAQRLQARGDADVEIEQVATPWLGTALRDAKLRLKTTPSASSVSFLPLRAPARAAPSQYSKERPFPAKVLQNQRITTRASTKDVRHIELSLEGSGLNYSPGDSLGVSPENEQSAVQELLSALRWDADVEANVQNQSHSASRWLSHQRDIAKLSRSLVEAHAERSGDAALRALVQPEQGEQLREFLSNTHLVDLLARYPLPSARHWQPSELLSLLRPLAPRLYSIASAASQVGAEVHLTVAHVVYALHGTQRFGAASHTLANAQEGASLPVFIETNERFRLPTDRAKDVIMIGPGTGVAPFRAFLQERIETGATGRNWLFFGNPHFREDFLYQLEWQQALKAKTLDRLDLAFSRDGANRDGANKVYVQHRVLEQAKAVFSWLENGAHLYVCGDSAHMAKDVDAALRVVVAQEKCLDQDGVADYFAQLQQQNRYQRDVY